MTRFVRACLAGVLIIGAASSAAAQGTTGSIAGFITDDTNAALPGATVTIRHMETDQKRTIVTDAAGRYRAPQLAPGRYEVTVELSGFRTSRASDIALTVGQDATVSLQLKVGGVDESLIVVAESALVNVRQSSVTALVDEKQVRELPLN